MEFRKCYWVLIFILVGEYVYSQSEKIVISGRITNNKGTGTIYQAIIVNQRTATGVMANSGDGFTIDALKSDTILINAPGFVMKKVCFNDSLYKNKYQVNIRLDSLHYELQEVSVYPHRNLEEIKEEEKTLGVIPNTNLNKTCDTTALLLQLLTFHLDIDGIYEKWSVKEREKRKVANLEDVELKRNILKELFIFYRRNNIISLDDNELDKFIDYCSFTDSFIKNSTDYELLTNVREKCAQFEKKNDYVLSGLR